jgi:hypothetical protein
MATTLRVKNESGAELEIQTGGAPVKIAAGAEADLTEKQLASKGFSEAVQAGSVSFVNIMAPTQEQVDLARKILPALVSSLGERIGNVKGRFEKSQGELLKMRTSFNKSWKVAESQFVVAQASTAGWPTVKKAVKNLLFDTAVEDPAVTAKKQEIKDLEDDIVELNKEDLAVSGRTLEEWFTDRNAKEMALTKAKDDLNKLNAQKTDLLATPVASIDGAVTALSGLTKAKAIGTEIPEFGK